MSNVDRRSVAFTLGGIPVRLTVAGERWVAHVGESVAVGRTAQQAFAAALGPVREASLRALLADLALLGPSIEVAQIETALRTA
jgi:hypothetical protein